MKSSLRRVAALAMVLTFSACSSEAVDDPLPALGAELTTVTVSGISSGAYMAVQYQVAHSATVAGAAVLAGGPWNCARAQVLRALGECIKGPRDAVPVQDLLADAREAAARGSIDALEHLAADRVWVFHGRMDHAVDASVSEALLDFYSAYVPPDRVEFVDSINAAHTFPTRNEGGPCDAVDEPYLGACGYDAAGELLQSLYEELEEPASTAGSGTLEVFDQRPFRDRFEGAGLADEGYVFIPEECRGEASTCRVHVALHGCRQGAEFVADAFVARAGYNRWAGANRIIVLYPQVRSTLSPLNPNGCWDWWGYEGPDYALKSGAQIAALHAMIERLGGSGGTDGT